MQSYFFYISLLDYLSSEGVKYLWTISCLINIAGVHDGARLVRARVAAPVCAFILTYFTSSDSFCVGTCFMNF